MTIINQYTHTGYGTFSKKDTGISNNRHNTSNISTPHQSIELSNISGDNIQKSNSPSTNLSLMENIFSIYNRTDISKIFSGYTRIDDSSTIDLPIVDESIELQDIVPPTVGKSVASQDTDYFENFFQYAYKNKNLLFINETEEKLLHILSKSENKQNINDIVERFDSETLETQEIADKVKNTIDEILMEYKTYILQEEINEENRNLIYKLSPLLFFKNCIDSVKIKNTLEYFKRHLDATNSTPRYATKIINHIKHLKNSENNREIVELFKELGTIINTVEQIQKDLAKDAMRPLRAR